MKAWNIKQMEEALQNDLLSCNSDLERSMVKAISGKEIREKAQEWSQERRLTTCEIAIASKYGYRYGMMQGV